MSIQETYSTENLVKRAIIDNGDGTTSISTNAKINVDTVNLTAEMKVDSGHDLYGAINVTKVADLQVSFDAIIGLKLAQIQSVENKTQGWVYNTKGATVTDTGITLVEANQNTGYPVIGASDEIEVIYRGVSRFDNKATEATLSSLEGKDFATESTLDSIKDSITDGTQVSNAYGVYNATEPSLSDGEKAPLQLNEAGELKVTGGAGASSVSAEFVSPSDFSATYTSSSTLTLSGVPFTVTDSSQVAYIKQVKSDSTSRTYVNGANDITLSISSNVITVYEKGVVVTSLASGDVYEVGLNSQRKSFDPSTNSTMVSPLKNVWNQYLDVETIVTAQDLTNAYADFGGEIDMRGYTHLRVGIVLDVNDSENITMKLLGLNESGGTDEFEIEGGLTQAIAHTADGKYSYEFDVKGSPFVQIQAIAGTVGATAGDLTLTISKIWK